MTVGHSQAHDPRGSWCSSDSAAKHTDVYKVYLYQHQVADPNVYQDSVLNCNKEWQSAIDIHHRSNQSGLGRYNRYTYILYIQSYILYGIILLYKPVTVTGNNSPRRDMCYTHNHDVRQGTT